MSVTSAEERLDKWLNTTFNDLYTVYSEYDCELHTVAYPPEATVFQFIKFLESKYPGLNFNETDHLYSNRTFSILCEPYGSIDIECFDDEIYHIELLKGE